MGTSAPVLDTAAPALDAAARVPDTELMARLRAGDAGSMERLLARHRRPLVQFLHRMVQNKDTAEELAQDVFLRVYLSRERYQPAAKFTTWLYRIATNRALNWLRDHRREAEQESLDENSWLGLRPQVVDPAPRADRAMLKEETARSIRRAVAELPGRQRAAVLMHKYEELDYGQIAEALGTTPAAVKAVLFRAYSTLRTRLGPMVRA